MRIIRIKTIIPVLLFLLIGCGKTEKPRTKVFGSLKGIMKENNIQSKVSLDSFKNSKNIWALGALENLSGEIMIYKGHSYISKAEGNSFSVKESHNEKAALLALATVNDWEKSDIPDSITSINDIETYLSSVINKRNMNTSRPIPFRIEGIADFAQWHIINWDPEAGTPHSHKSHQRNSTKGYIHSAGIDIIGFYSESPGLITHMGNKTHMHIKTMDNYQAGHLDEIKLSREAELFLPK